MKNYIFDSSVLISFFDKEKNAYAIASVLKEINRKNYNPIISVINLGEVYYHFLKTSDKLTADTVIDKFIGLNFIIMDIDWGLTRIAATFKSKHKMSYADTFAAALCKVSEGILITSDKEFLSLEKEIKINFL
ncbi:hypothetical protein BH10BAC5_BH10BAC5_27780 [soil metagenome]